MSAPSTSRSGTPVPTDFTSVFNTNYALGPVADTSFHCDDLRDNESVTVQFKSKNTQTEQNYWTTRAGGIDERFLGPWGPNTGNNQTFRVVYEAGMSPDKQTIEGEAKNATALLAEAFQAPGFAQSGQEISLANHRLDGYRFTVDLARGEDDKVQNVGLSLVIGTTARGILSGRGGPNATFTLEAKPTRDAVSTDKGVNAAQMDIIRGALYELTNIDCDTDFLKGNLSQLQNRVQTLGSFETDEQNKAGLDNAVAATAVFKERTAGFAAFVEQANERLAALQTAREELKAAFEAINTNVEVASTSPRSHSPNADQPTSAPAADKIDVDNETGLDPVGPTGDADGADTGDQIVVGSGADNVVGAGDSETDDEALDDV